MAMNSDERVRFNDGTLVPRVAVTKYLGFMIQANSGLEAEIRYRISQSEQAFKKLHAVWRGKTTPLG
eukprot:15015799-Alexandrium_andersonii.AAC.1